MTEQRCDTHPAVGFPEWGPIPELNKGAVEGGGGVACHKAVVATVSHRPYALGIFPFP